MLRRTFPSWQKAKEEKDENSYSQKLKLAQSQRVAKNGRSQISISWAAPAAAGGASREKLGIYQVDIITGQSSKVREAELCVIYYTYTTTNKFCISGPLIYADLCTLWPAR